MMYIEQNGSELQRELKYTIGHGQYQKSILIFLQNNLPGIPRNLCEGAQSDLTNAREDVITGEIVNLLNDKLRETSGGYLFRFEAKSGPDILIFATPYEAFSEELFVIEAKRLPPTSHRDYVKGGIGRFKREEHGKQHNMAAMLGYVQSENFAYWYNEVNRWIEDLISANDNNIRWEQQDRICIIQIKDIGEYKSKHSRIIKNAIILYHFWINLFSIDFRLGDIR
jgi:hypothetical protein